MPPPLKRILVADLPAGVATLENVIGIEAVILGANSLPQAISFLRSTVSLVVCGIHFDDSRMFDLLRMAKADPSTRDVPFLCYRDMDSALSSTVLESLRIACQALGAAAFVDLFELKSRYGVQEADQRFRQVILNLLDTAS